jgi:hypothetical protein
VNYQEALAEASRVGASKASGPAFIAQTLDVFCKVHVGINPSMAFDGAIKLNLNDKDFQKMLKDPFKVGDLMFV